MAFDETLAARVRQLLIPREGYDEKKMFGGICFMLHGRMVCGIVRDRLIVRVGPDGYDAALTRPHTAVFDITRRAMTGWVQVAPEGWARDDDLADWVERGTAYATSLPPKVVAAKRPASIKAGGKASS